MNEIARVHVDDYEPEIYAGEDALMMANAAAALFRTDFPDSVIGVSFNPAAAESNKRMHMERWGLPPSEAK